MVGGRSFLLAPVLLAILANAAGQSRDIYQAREIEIRPDPGFGRGTDWASFIENEANSLAVAPDGSIFVAQPRAHTVHKFDRSGRLVKSFGRRGQGPGDFQSPLHLSILDGNYLVVGEHAEGRRISLFDLDGRFVKLVRTSQGPFAAMAVRDGVVAYVAKSFPRKGPLVLQESSVVLLDTDSGKETVACDHTSFVDEPQVFASPGGPLPNARFGRGDMVINRTSKGELAVGYTTSPKIVVFAPDGRRLREFAVDYPALKLTDDIWRRYLDWYYETAAARDPGADPGQLRRRVDRTPRVIEYLPYLADILADAEGRLLVVRKTGCYGSCDPAVRVYTPEGRLVGQTVLRGGDFGVEIDRRFRNLVFAADGLYGVFLVRGSPDDERRLVRVKF